MANDMYIQIPEFPPQVNIVAPVINNQDIADLPVTASDHIHNR
jgi:hypothetical protein